MALKLTASASGKVILHGEHSVVYGKPAIAGVIGLRNYLTLEANSKTKIILNFDSFSKPIEYDLTTINKFLHNENQKYFGKDLPSSINHEEFFDSVQKFVTENSAGLESPNDKTIYATIYLLIGILISNRCEELKYGFTLTMKSGLTMGAGLGSSASFGVCLAGVFHFYALIRLNSTYVDRYNNRSSINEKNAIKTIISEWAFCSEKIMHGNPSGLDNTICTFGNVVKFYRGETPTPIALKMPLNILLVNTGVSRSTVALVKQVAELKAKYPTLIDHVLNAMGALVDDAAKILENLTTENENISELKRLVSINNNLLRTIGVSHPSLEQIFSICEANGFASKLTGAGGGGYATVLLPSNYETLDSFKELCTQLDEKKFEWISTTIGGGGFEIVEE